MSDSSVPPVLPFPDDRPALLQVKDLSVRFQTGGGMFYAVHNISFAVERGQVLCLVGESGCGKSMTALAILRLLPEAACQETGSVLLNGEDLSLLSDAALCRVRGRQVGMIFQEPMTSLNPVVTVGDQVAETLERHEGLSYHSALDVTASLFQQVGIPAPATRLRDYPHQLSGGMRQRVMTAMALACNPSLLLADEPTTALDVTIQGQILRLLKQQTTERGMGLVLITHDLGVVAEMADNVGVMYAGRMVEKAPVRALFREPLHPYTQGLMGASPSFGTRHMRHLHTVPGTVPSAKELCGALAKGCPFRPRCAKAMPVCETSPPHVNADEGHMVSCWLHAG